jgi:branched-chain amino acid transport system substrate-binding protein
VALDKPGNVVAVLANDNAFGRDGVKAFKEFTKNAKIVHEEYLPVEHHRLHRRPAAHHRQAQGPAGQQVHVGGLVGQPGPFPKIADLDLEKRYGIELATGGNILPAMVATRTSPAWKARCTTTSASPRTR